jgi:hypothetical protein
LVHKYKVDISGDILCKFHVFSFYFVLHMASWLLVAVNIDRLIAASFLSLSKKWCTPRTALKVSLYLSIVLTVLNAHFIYFVDSSVHDYPKIKVNLDNKSSPASLIDAKSDNYSTQTFLFIGGGSGSVRSKHNRTRLRADGSEQQEWHTTSYLFSTFLSPKLTTHEDDNETYEMRPKEAINPYVYQKCLIKANYPRYSFFFQNIFTWIDASAQVILPFIIMLVCNVNIIHKVLLTKNRTNGRNIKRLRKIKGNPFF